MLVGLWTWSLCRVLFGSHQDSLSRHYAPLHQVWSVLHLPRPPQGMSTDSKCERSSRASSSRTSASLHPWRSTSHQEIFSCWPVERRLPLWWISALSAGKSMLREHSLLSPRCMLWRSFSGEEVRISRSLGVDYLPFFCGWRSAFGDILPSTWPMRCDATAS